MTAYARAHPLAIETVRAGAAAPNTRMLALKDRKPGFERPLSAHLEIPVGYRAAFSIEEQPAGLCAHLSVSVDTRGKTPSEIAVLTIAEAFGMKPPFLALWVEEFDPGHHAVNVVASLTPRREGTA